jgi:uncharacterized protein YdeI (YjbR/CyaY-like superfamily)
MPIGAVGSLQTMGESQYAAIYFATSEDLRRWLQQHHQSARELWVGFYKKRSRRPSITWPESVDEALAFGWIDGVRKSVSTEAYVIRFTPRKPSSIWSNVNIRKAEALIQSDRMQPAGRRAFEARKSHRSGIYAFEQPTPARLAPRELKQFRANAKAWTFFRAQPPSDQRTAIWRVISAKRPETRARRLSTLIDDSACGQPIRRLRRTDANE